jgi:hypothetical protein
VREKDAALFIKVDVPSQNENTWTFHFPKITINNEPIDAKSVTLKWKPIEDIPLPPEPDFYTCRWCPREFKKLHGMMVHAGRMHPRDLAERKALFELMEEL